MTPEAKVPVICSTCGSSVFAEQAVVQAAEPPMVILPQNHLLLAWARVDAMDVDQTNPSQPVTLRVSAFNQRVTPELEGRIVSVSADAFENPQTGVPFYRVEVVALGTELAKIDGDDMRPGKPVKAELRTEDRTSLSYLTKPLTDYFERAVRES